MNKRGGKKYSKVRKEVDSFLYDKDRKEVESFLDGKNNKKNKKNKTNNKLPNEKKKKIKFGKGDVVFVIVYLIILIILMIISPVYMVGGYDSVIEESKILWDSVFWILLYAIVVPILYILIRWGYQRKK